LLIRGLPDQPLADRAGFHDFRPKTSRSRFCPACPDSSFADTTTTQFAAQCRQATRAIYAYDAYILEAARSSGFPLSRWAARSGGTPRHASCPSWRWTYEPIYVLDGTAAPLPNARGGFSRRRSPDPTSGWSRVRRDAGDEASAVAVCKRHRFHWAPTDRSHSPCLSRCQHAISHFAQ
jgi:hypothetical protein